MLRDLWKLSLAFLLLSHPLCRAQFPSDEDIENYPEYAEILEGLNYDWKPHMIKSEDGWYLSAIRIRPERDNPYQEGKNTPLLLLHGSFDSALGYVNRASNNKGWALQLSWWGYDVWLLNARGTKYSYKHERDGEWTLKEKWNFSWADMGIYDVPAVIDYILKETGAPKVTVIGHSQGTSQMWYGLSHKQDYYAQKVERFIALASCTTPELYPNLPYDYEGLTALFLKTDELGFYNIFGEDESSVSIFKFFCIVLEDPLFCLSDKYIMPIYPGFQADAASTTALLHFSQIQAEQRFQEPQTLERYAMGERITPLIPIWNIDRVPVTFIHSPQDGRCPMAFAEWIYSQLPVKEKALYTRNVRHNEFNRIEDISWVYQLDEIIRTGYASETSYPNDYSGSLDDILSALSVTYMVLLVWTLLV